MNQYLTDLGRVIGIGLGHLAFCVAIVGVAWELYQEERRQRSSKNLKDLFVVNKRGRR